MKKIADKNDTKKVYTILLKGFTIFREKNKWFILIIFWKEIRARRWSINCKKTIILVMHELWYWCWKSIYCLILKYRGKLGEYRNWAVFPPKETTPDRMGRFGVSYYNMMRSRKLGNQNDRDKLAQF